MLARLSLVAALCQLTACAAALPGYSPPPYKEPSALLKPMESGSMRADGRYAMSETEKAMDCKRMTGSMLITIARLKDARTRAVGSELAMSTQKAVKQMSGGSTLGTDPAGEHARERAKLAAYNDELGARNCARLDIEAEMARPPDGFTKY